MYYGQLLIQNGKRQHDQNFKKQIRKSHATVPPIIENHRRAMYSNHHRLETPSPGAGSRKKKQAATISEYARRTSISRSEGNLLFQIATFLKPDRIIELGTSLGFSTMYMAYGSPYSQIFTVEGNRQIADIAEASFKQHHLSQIKVIHKLFDDALPELVRVTTPGSMVFIDGNHSYEATMKYVNAFATAGLIILDDIRWSEQMIRAWNEISSSGQDIEIIDLFSLGIIIRK